KREYRRRSLAVSHTSLYAERSDACACPGDEGRREGDLSEAGIPAGLMGLGGLSAITPCKKTPNTPSPRPPHCPSATGALRTSCRHHPGRSFRLVPSVHR